MDLQSGPFGTLHASVALGKPDHLILRVKLLGYMFNWGLFGALSVQVCK